MTDHLKEYIEEEVQNIFHDKCKKLLNALCEELPGGVAKHGGSNTFYLKQKLQAEDYRGHAGNSGSTILTDCFGHIFPENVYHSNEGGMISDLVCLLSLASGHSLPTREMRELKREHILNEIRQTVMDKMMKNLPKDDAPEEKVIITGKDIGVSKG